MNTTEQRKNAREFVKRWQAAEGNEQRESNSFWIELCQNVLGIANPTTVLDFERKVKGRRIDVFYEDRSVLIENKSRGVSLDAAEQRGWINRAKGVARMVTPFEQAKWYADNITPRSIMPRWVITCNFDEIRIHDLDREDADTNFETIRLEDLPNEFHRLGFLTSKSNSRIEREKELSVKAGGVVGSLYDAFAGAYLDIENDEREQRSLNILITRIVFLLFAEDADLLHERDGFYKYLKGFQVQHMRQALIDLFSVLKTPKEERDPYLSHELTVFPYINGGLFADDIIVPQFDVRTHDILLNEASAEFDWSHISPTIFGAVFESTLNPETRRAGGMHYTSIENIHKVTGPLFYDALRDELTEIEGAATEKERRFKLQAFRKKLSTIKVLDPACGSGNFLTETYISLRKLENRVLESLYGDQMALGVLDPIQVTLDQFYGIEINDFAVEVAKTALWIAELQMLDQTREILGIWIDPLPLKTNDNIVCGNALRMDWNDLLPAEQCTYICGNPPFLGSSVRTKEQTDDLAQVFGKEKKWSKCDYCVGWYRKAADYMHNTNCHAALVSTNSITQGEQVQPTWERLFNLGVQIDFAYRTFIWDSEATDKAHVHCVVIGFSYAGGSRRTIYEDDLAMPADNINGYLIDAPNLFIRSRGKPVDDCHLLMTQGSKPVDGGNLILSKAEVDDLVAKHSEAACFIRQYVGAREFISGKPRYVLWLKGLGMASLNIDWLRPRLEAVTAARLASPTREFQKYADKPWLFVQDRQPNDDYLVLPRTTSGRRLYVPLGFNHPDVIASDKLIIMPGATLYDFGLLSSRMHAAWMRLVSGRLKSDYEYSSGVYNNLAYPEATEEQHKEIERLAERVLDNRAAHENDSLATLYDPDKMPADLLAAHQALDAAVEAAYGIDFHGDEEKIVAHLFKLYAEKTGGN